MDPLSQGALGAACATSAARPGRTAAAVAVGAAAGMAADLDVLIRSSSDPLLFLDYHRQFSHALLFIPFGAAVCALLAHPLARRWLTWRETWLYCLLGYASHGLLDACTSYGTQLLWPFSEARVAWNRVSVVDPLFTVPLLVLLAAAVTGRRAAAARLALAWALLYLALGVLQGWRAQLAAVALAEARGHEPQRLLVKPSFGNLLVWKSLYAAAGSYHVDALRLAADVTYFPGDRIAALDVERDIPWLVPGSTQARDLERFRRFSDGYLALDPQQDHVVVDVRYSMVPNRIDALWGVRFDPAVPGRHAAFVTDRASDAAQRAALWHMLTTPGVALPARNHRRGTTQKS